jgi:hypothetical protein
MEAGWKREKKINETQNNIATPNVIMVKIPPHECTTLMDIPGNATFSSQVTNFNDFVVFVGEYYYINKTKWVEKTSNKRKGKDTTVSQS